MGAAGCLGDVPDSAVHLLMRWYYSGKSLLYNVYILNHTLDKFIKKEVEEFSYSRSIDSSLSTSE